MKNRPFSCLFFLLLGLHIASVDIYVEDSFGVTVDSWHAKHVFAEGMP